MNRTSSFNFQTKSLHKQLDRQRRARLLNGRKFLTWNKPGNAVSRPGDAPKPCKMHGHQYHQFARCTGREKRATSDKYFLTEISSHLPTDDGPGGEEGARGGSGGSKREHNKAVGTNRTWTSKFGKLFSFLYLNFSLLSETLRREALKAKRFSLLPWRCIMITICPASRPLIKNNWPLRPPVLCPKFFLVQLRSPF